MVSVAQLCTHLNARYFFNGEEKEAPATLLIGFAELDKANKQQIAFINSGKFLPELRQSRAGIVILEEPWLGDCSVGSLLVEDAYLSFALASQLFTHRQAVVGQHIHPKSVIAEDVVLPKDIRIDAGAVIEEGVKLGEGCTIRANAVIASCVTMGKQCYIDVNASIMHHCILGDRCVIGPGSVIGSEGFGNAVEKKSQHWVSIHHQGAVRLEDDVEIGTNCTIDRGTIEDTVIARGVRIDNLVMVSHNCYVGEDSALAGQVGMAGHTHLGKRVKAAGQVGFVGHLEVANDSLFMGKTVVSGSVKQSGVYAGFPHQPITRWRKEVAMLRRQLKAFEYNKNKRNN